MQLSLSVTRRRVHVATAAVALLVAASAAATRPSTAPPRSARHHVRPLVDVAEETLAAIDRDALLRDDAATAGPGVPERVGVPLPVHLSHHGAGTWDALDEGGQVWRLRVRVPKALWLSFVFDEFDVPPGVEVHVYDPKGDEVVGPFTAAANSDSHVLATPITPGPAAVVEMFVPDVVDFTPRLELGTVVAGFKAAGPGGASAPCERDVNCPEGGPWQAEKRAVARIYFNGYLCTGTLVNDVPQDCRNYFLTANHCISSAADASACVFYWNYERPACGSGSGSLGQYQTGSTIRATNAASDFTLLELSAAPSSAFNVYYSGWNRSTTVASSVVGIHHPAGDVKKISLENHPLQGGAQNGPNFWLLPHWEFGATEGGSSGSGLWNPSHQLVGQLWGGSSYCPNPTDSDEYGKFSSSWSVGTTPATRLRDWLDPAATGAASLGGKESSACGTSAPCRTCPSYDFGPFAPASAYATHASSLAAGGCKLYALSVTQGCTYRLSFCEGGRSASFDSVLELLSASCVLQSQNDDSCGTASQLDFVASATGTVYAKVRGRLATSAGAYSLAYKLVGCPQPSTCLTCPAYDFGPLTPTTSLQTHASSVAAGGCRVYKFNVTAGARYRFTFCEGASGANFDTMLDVLSSGCSLRTTNDDSCGLLSRVEWTATTTGVAYVKVRGYAGAGGSYTMGYKRL